MAKKPNVIVILTDDQRYNTIHALGNEQIITPNIDWLVENGTSFTHAHIPGGTVGAVCMPSRAMLNTGRHLFHVENNGQTVPQDHTLMGEWFKQNGYYCYGTGKWHNSPQAFTRSFDSGDNAFFGGMWDHWNVPVNHYDETGEYDNVISFVSNFHATNRQLRIHCDKFNPGVHSSTLVTNTCVDFVDNYNEDKPFFLYAAYLAPHDPRTMPEKYLKMYNPDEIELPANFMSEHPFNFGARNIRDEVLAPYPRTEENTRQQLAEYYGMITHLDDELGRLIQSVKDKGEIDNTIFVFAGDNGLAMGCHGLFGKQNHYDHSIRVPLIISGAGIPKGEIRDQYVYLMDIFPTLCDILGGEIPSSVDGLSFAPSLEDKTFVSRENMYFAYTYLMRAVKDDRYKLIEYAGPSSETQLFDLVNDPDEINDLSKQEDMKENIERLRDLMQVYREDWEDEKHPLGEKFWALYDSKVK